MPRSPKGRAAARGLDARLSLQQALAGHLEQLPSTEPGVYRFKANLSVQGR